MRKIYFIIGFLFCFLASFANVDTLPVVTRSNSSIYVKDQRVKGGLNFVAPIYYDTTDANGVNNIGNNYEGSLIYTTSDQKVWVRKNQWTEVGAGGGGGAAWGSITGTLSNQTDLQTALNAKQNTITFGTGVQTALGVNIGSAGAVVLFNGAGGTPSSMTGTNITGTASGLNIGGNAATATILQTARNIQGVSFNGSANIDIINGTGFVKATGTTISYDNSTYVTGNIYTTNGTLAGNRAVALNSLTLNFNQGSNSFLSIDPTSGSEQAIFRSYNTTGGDNQGGLQTSTSATQAFASLSATFDGGTEQADISVSADASSSSISYTADVHTFNGDVVFSGTTDWGIDDVLSVVQPLTTNRIIDLGGQILTIMDVATNQVQANFEANNGIIELRTLNNSVTDNRGLISLESDVTGGKTEMILNGDYDDGDIEYEIRGVAQSSGSSITHTADTHTFNVAEGAVLDLISGQSRLRALDASNTDTRATFQADANGGQANAYIAADYNDGDNIASITAFSDVSTAQITLQGQVVPSEDNTYALGDATHRFTELHVMGSSIKMYGSSSGVITIGTQAAAGTFNWNLPTGAGSSGQPLLSGGGGATAMSFGTLGATAGGTGLTSGTSGGINYWSSTTTMASSGALAANAVVAGGGAGNSPITTSTATAMTSTNATGTGFVPAVMYSRNTGSFSMSDINTVQPVFPTTADVITVQASTLYYFTGRYYLQHGSTSHSVGMSFELGGGASLTSIAYDVLCEVTVANTNTASQTQTNVTQATNTTINSAGSNAQETIFFSGVIAVNSGGTITPSITFSAAPGGAPTSAINSYIMFWPIGTNTQASQGPVN